MQVFVLLFNARTENEGIHTLKMGDRDMILMFESEEDAIRYGVMLEAQDMPSPTVESLDSEDIETFCRDAGYDYRLIPEGTLELPPEANVEETDWQPNARPNPEDDRPSFSETELEQLRKRLENLL